MEDLQVLLSVVHKLCMGQIYVNSDTSVLGFDASWFLSSIKFIALIDLF